MAFKNYYQLLNISTQASQIDIREAYRKLARQYHPDMCQDAEAEDRMKEINEAYAVLKDEQRRNEFHDALDFDDLLILEQYDESLGINQADNLSDLSLDDDLPPRFYDDIHPANEKESLDDLDNLYDNLNLNQEGAFEDSNVDSCYTSLVVSARMLPVKRSKCSIDTLEFSQKIVKACNVLRKSGYKVLQMIPIIENCQTTSVIIIGEKPSKLV